MEAMNRRGAGPINDLMGKVRAVRYAPAEHPGYFRPASTTQGEDQPMSENEIRASISPIDDPDEQVFEQVRQPSSPGRGRGA